MKTKLVTHDGRFHADEVFATAAFQILFEKRNQEIEIIRTRDPEIINSGDIVYDVGQICDSEKNRFDHHQEGGGGERENGIPFSSFGLVWKKYGTEICDNEKEVADLIEERLVQQIDLGDTGHYFYEEKSGLKSFDPDDLVKSFNLIRGESRELEDEYFFEMVSLAKKIIERQISCKKLKLSDREKVSEVYENSTDKRIIVMDEPYSWGLVLVEKPEPLYAIHPGFNSNFIVRAIPIEKDGIDLKKPFPAEWRGKSESDLRKITGVDSVTFCHLSGFLCVANKLEDAIKLAQISADN